MKSHARTIVVLAVALALVVLFLSNVNLWGVAAAIARARPEWLALSLLTMFLNLAIRALRWQYLLEPLGEIPFASAFRPTAAGCASSAVLPPVAAFMLAEQSMSMTTSRPEPTSKSCVKFFTSGRLKAITMSRMNSARSAARMASRNCIRRRCCT